MVTGITSGWTLNWKRRGSVKRQRKPRRRRVLRSDRKVVCCRRQSYEKILHPIAKGPARSGGGFTGECAAGQERGLEGPFSMHTEKGPRARLDVWPCEPGMFGVRKNRTKMNAEGRIFGGRLVGSAGEKRLGAWLRWRKHVRRKAWSSCWNCEWYDGAIQMCFNKFNVAANGDQPRNMHPKSWCGMWLAVGKAF